MKYKIEQDNEANTYHVKSHGMTVVELNRGELWIYNVWFDKERTILFRNAYPGRKDIEYIVKVAQSWNRYQQGTQMPSLIVHDYDDGPLTTEQWDILRQRAGTKTGRMQCKEPNEPNEANGPSE